jgi:hypothetical protein
VTLPASPLSADLASDPHAAHVGARLRDFFADTTPWPRRLWDISSVLALREAHEAARWHARRVLSTGAVTWYLRALERQLGPDRGLGDSKLRRLLTGLLRSGLGPDSPERRQLDQLMPMIVGGYLDRWRDAVDAGPLPSAERLARAVATHLLDLGHSSGQLYRWVREMMEKPGTTIGDLLDSACALARRRDADHEVLVPFRSVPDHQRLAARGESGSRLEPVGQVWIAGHAALPVTAPARGVDALSLVREKTMYSTASNDLIDDALELAAPLNAGPPAPAVSGGWSAIESLLSHPADTAEGKPGRVIAADRLAAIVTCSWPRAELTALSYRHHPAAPDALSSRLDSVCRNRDRCQAVADTLLAGQTLATGDPSDMAAAQRMTAVLANPYEGLRDVRMVFELVLRRLYRQRNIVVHGGTTASVAMDATLRTAAPLVGAGLDRIMHAKLTTHVGPLELAARAANSLELVGDDIGPSVVTMLE